MASVRVDVDIDVFDDAEVLCAAKERGYRVLISNEQMDKFHEWDKDRLKKLEVDEYEERIADDDLSDLHLCLKERRHADALAIVESLMFPKFKTLSECMDKYSKVRLTP